MIEANAYLQSVRQEFERYKSYGDKTFAQLSDGELFHRPGYHDNSIAQLIKHLSGNMLSRWTDFLTTDGEKPWRDREMEFMAPPETREELLHTWDKGWNRLFAALDGINDTNIGQRVVIRGQQHSIIQAIHRQLAHYAAHVGQIVFLGKMIKGGQWTSLSIPKGGSAAFNKKMFGQNS